MRKSDVFIFGDRAWQLVEMPHGSDHEVHLRMLAGPDGERRRQTIPLSFLQGRPVYRMVNAVEDADLDHAVQETTGDLVVAELGHDPRKWTETFCQRFSSRVTPDVTIMLGWFATAIEAGVQAGREQLREEIALRERARRRAATKRAKASKRSARSSTRP